MQIPANRHQWLSPVLRQAVKTSEIPQYLIARQLKMDRSMLSAWICGITRVRVGDPRATALGRLFNVPPERCFSARAPRPATRRRPCLLSA